LLHHRAKEARNRKARVLRELEENHPLFDKPLFIIPRHGKFRQFCKNVVDAQYNAQDKISGAEKNIIYFRKIRGISYA
jgi:hypothetical protein